MFKTIAIVSLSALVGLAATNMITNVFRDRVLEK